MRLLHRRDSDGRPRRCFRPRASHARTAVREALDGNLCRGGFAIRASCGVMNVVGGYMNASRHGSTPPRLLKGGVLASASRWRALRFAQRQSCTAPPRRHEVGLLPEVNAAGTVRVLRQGRPRSGSAHLEAQIVGRNSPRNDKKPRGRHGATPDPGRTAGSRASGGGMSVGGRATARKAMATSGAQRAQRARRRFLRRRWRGGRAEGRRREGREVRRHDRGAKSRLKLDPNAPRKNPKEYTLVGKSCRVRQWRRSAPAQTSTCRTSRCRG